MPAWASPLCWNLLVLGACSGLSAGCRAVDGRGECLLPDIGLTDSTFALQTQSVYQITVYESKLNFVLTGMNYESIAASPSAEHVLRSIVASSVCEAWSISLPASDCRVVFSLGSAEAQATTATPTGSSARLAVDLSIYRISPAEAQATTAKFEALTATVLPGIVSSVNSNHLLGTANGSPFGQAIGIENAATSTVPEIGDEASARDDPHLTSVTGNKFDVNMPGSYVLLRAPQDQRLPAKLELNATLRPSAGAPCGLYIQRLELGGEWLGGQVVGVVPLQRDVEGENGAGSSTLRPFSVLVVEVQRGASRARTSARLEQWGQLGSEGRNLSGRVRLVPVWRQVYADAGRPQEAQAFQFHIRGAGAGQGVTLEAAQAAHQSLDFRAEGLRSLGLEELGGLLGTEGHDEGIERVADECKAWRARFRMSSRGSSGSSMAASWGAPF